VRRLVISAGVSAVALGVLLRTVPVEDVVAAVSRIPPSLLLAVVGLHALIFAVTTARWSLLFIACGSPARPRFAHCYRAYWIGQFYNTWLPGGLGGDVARAVATRRAVGDGGLPTAFAIILLERAFGAATLLLLAFASASVLPLPGLDGVRWWSALGLAATLTAVLLLVTAPRLATRLPDRIARVTRSLPPITSPRHALGALGLSAIVQVASVGAAHLVMSSTGAPVTWRDALAVLPLANAAAFFPLTVAGVGARETAFVALYGYVGVPRASALAAALAISALTYIIGGIGGIVHLVAPLTVDTEAVAMPAGARGSPGQPA
jgi:uncharacterized membrane protein YbhN (UPF0104 family)